MRNPKVVVGLILLAMTPILLGMKGCIVDREEADLILDITPGVAYVGQPVNLTFTLREVDGVGVNLNHWRYEVYDEEDNLVNVIDLRDHDAHLEFNKLFGTYYVHGHGTLSGTIRLTPLLPRGHLRWLFGGIDTEIHSVQAASRVLIK